MSSEVVSLPARVVEICGSEFWSRLTYPGIYRGAPRSVSPVVVWRGDHAIVVISDPDSDACNALPAGIGQELYGRYFSWDKFGSDCAPLDFAGAVIAAGGDTLVCAPDLVVARFEQLAARADIKVRGREAAGPLYLYRKAKAEVVAQWQLTRDADVARVRPIASQFPNGDILCREMLRPISGYAALDRLAQEAAVGALCVTAPHEVEMFTGLPYEQNAALGAIAIWVPGEDVLVATRQPIVRGDFRAQPQSALLSDILRPLGPVAVQKNDMGIGPWLDLVEAGVDLLAGDEILRRFQDCRVGEDLVYFFVAANAMLHGIAEARKGFDKFREASVSERDLVALHHGGVRRFLRSCGFEGRETRCFDVVHSGSRTHLPATACDAVVSGTDTTIKFDMGIFVKDAAGCVRGVSDIARTICTRPELTRFAKTLREEMIATLVPGIRPGMTGAEVHALGIEALKPLEDEMRRLGLLPDGASVENYTRDCGHTLQRQTISSVYFLPTNRNTVELGMLGCVEYVWPFRDVLLAVEDGYVVTEAGTIPFTAEPSL